MASVPHSNHSLLSCLARPSSQSQFAQPFPSYDQHTRKAAPSTSEMKQTEDFITAECNKLSSQEQSKALDLYWAGEELNHSLVLVMQSLAEFQRQLEDGNFPIYIMAVDQNREYVENPLFRLTFLRANTFNVKNAVNQMLSFFRLKATYFGTDKIARDITLRDLNDDDIELMMSGMYHIQNGTDQDGRVILYVLNNMIGQCEIENLVRVNDIISSSNSIFHMPRSNISAVCLGVTF